MGSSGQLDEIGSVLDAVSGKWERSPRVSGAPCALVVARSGVEWVLFFFLPVLRQYKFDYEIKISTPVALVRWGGTQGPPWRNSAC